MKKLTYLLLILAFAGGSALAQTRSERLAEYVYYFASDSLKGRGAGTASAAKAREYIIQRYKECGLKPLSGNDFHIYFQKGGTQYCNVVGIIEGTDLKDEYIVLGAHYDHLGVKRGKIYPGADDNASGSAALIEIARELAARKGQLHRSVIIAAFDAEELGLYGSTNLAEYLDAAVGLDKVKLMMSVDMVGRYGTNGALTLEGVATIRDGKRIAKEAAAKHTLKLKTKDFETSVFTATDTEGFAKRQVPTLAVSTGLHPQYHKPTDKADLIDYEGLDKVTGYLTDFASQAASDPEFAASGKVARKHLGKNRVFEAGVTGSLGNAAISFPKADLSTKGRMDYTVGLTSRLNFDGFGFQVDALWESASSRFPSLDPVFGPAQDYTQRSLTVPAYLLLLSDSSELGAFVGFGGYYSYVYSHSFSKADPGWTVNPHQGGLAANFGIRAAGLVLEWSFRWQMGDLFIGAQEARIQPATYLKLSWLF
ncbi:MAG: M28 family peptidase [Bacteroidales bacterium]|nr:M28 family peptidase [Bacteroidales bacterium]